MVKARVLTGLSSCYHWFKLVLSLVTCQYCRLSIVLTLYLDGFKLVLSLVKARIITDYKLVLSMVKVRVISDLSSYYHWLPVNIVA